MAELRDVVCSQAGDATFTGNLGAFPGSVLAIQAGLGFGALLQDVFPLMANADIATGTAARQRHRRPTGQARGWRSGRPRGVDKVAERWSPRWTSPRR